MRHFLSVKNADGQPLMLSVHSRIYGVILPLAAPIVIVQAFLEGAFSLLDPHSRIFPVPR